MVTVSVTAANICCLPRRPQTPVRQRIKQAMNLDPAAPAWFSEIEIPRYRRAVRVQSAKHGRTVVAASGADDECPVTLPAGWVMKSWSRSVVHGGKAGVSPHRIVTEVLASHEGEAFALMATHAVSKPYRGPKSWVWRIAMYRKHKAWLRARIAQRRLEKFTTVFGGDMNKRAPGKFHSAQVHIARSGLDHLWVVPRLGTRAVVHKQRIVKRTKLMDHPIINGSFDLVAA